MTKTRTLFLAAACTVTGAAGAAGVGAIASSANNGSHGGGHNGAKQRLHHGKALGRAVHAEAVVPVRDGTFATVTFDRGVVKSVSGDQLTITEGTKDATYKDADFTVPADAKIRRRGTANATLADLQAGDRVAVIQRAGKFVVLAGPARADGARRHRR